MTTISSHDIRSVLPGKASALTSLSNAATKALREVNNPNKFDRAGLNQAGLDRLFDKTQRTVLNATSNKTATEIVGNKLTNQQTLMKDINDIMVKFESEIPGLGDVYGSREEIVNRALDSISEKLSQKDASGEYVLGANSLNTDPMTKLDGAGNRVAIDLTAVSNVVEGIMIDNYSDVGQDNSVVTVSSIHEVSTSIVNVRDPAFVKMIGYLNLHKAGNSTDKELDTARIDQIDARGDLKIKVDFELENVGIARDTNKADLNVANDIITNVFAADMTQRTGEAGVLIQSLLAAATVETTISQLSSRLLDKLPTG